MDSASNFTWVTSEIVSAALLNTHLRDNLLETAPAKASAAGQTVFSTAANAIAMAATGVRKTSDESVNNSTTLQDDDALLFAVAASEVWAFHLFVYFTIASGNPSFKYGFTVPTAGSGFVQAIFGSANLDGGNSSAVITNANSLPGSAQAFPFSGLTSGVFTATGIYIGGGNAGNVQFQWAQNSAVASNLTVKAGSHFDLKRLA